MQRKTAKGKSYIVTLAWLVKEAQIFSVWTTRKQRTYQRTELNKRKPITLHFIATTTTLPIMLRYGDQYVATTIQKTKQRDSHTDSYI